MSTLSRVIFDPDITPPSTPGGVTATALSTSAIRITWNPCTDTGGSGLSGYRVLRSTTSGGSYSQVSQDLTVSSLSYDDTGLSASTQRFYRVVAFDGNANVSAQSPIVNATTQANPPAQTDSWWPNWPIMNATLLQGSASSTYLDPANHSMIADKDWVGIQSIYPTTSRIQARRDAMAAVRALQASPMRTRFFIYCQPRATFKTITNPGNNELEVNKELIDDPVKGRESWYVHRVNSPTIAGRVENEFDVNNHWQVNMAVLVGGLNSFGENYAFAYWKEWNLRWVIGADDLRPSLDGVFMDAVEQRPPPMSQNLGTLSITDHDFNGDGVADLRGVFSAASNAGGRMWSQGNMEFKAQYEARNPGKFVIPNSATWDTMYLDGDGAPSPMSSGVMYRQWEVILDETTSFSLGPRIASGGTSYFTQGGSASGYFRNYELQERHLKLDANIPAAIGRGAVLCHATAINRVPTQTDIEFVRTLSLLPLLTERGAPCVQQGGARPFSLDELLVELGNPIATRSMGTLNESTIAWTMRAADQSVGVARFYWARFEKGIVVARLDHPTLGVWPSSDAAVSCTLPAPGTGKKWQLLNAQTYVNPITGRATRNQTPTLNNGADVATVSLRPLHAMLVRLVNV